VRPPPSKSHETAVIVYVNRSVVAAIDYTTVGKLVGTRKPNVHPSPQDEDVGGLPVSAAIPCWRSPGACRQPIRVLVILFVFVLSSN
jgi:hypothetical protein